MKHKEKATAHVDVPIPEKLYYKIGEVSEIAGVEPYVLRYWESEFDIVKPSRTRSKQRLYRRKDLELILAIKKLLYEEQFTIAGAKKRLKESSIKNDKKSKNTFSNEEFNTLLQDVKEGLETIKGILE
ncbi:MAG: MerR family transcriptional regulator [Thermodesulfobacteriota bacterium]|nr:MerR family transcriptional regulator [Thermodesulfobacteriota bacterium]